MEFVNFIFSNAFVIMFLPIWVAFLITLNSTVPYFRSKHFTINLTLISTGISAIYSICLLYITSSTNMLFNNDVINWLQIGNSYLSFGFLLDNISALCLTVFTVISFLIQLYSYEHIKKEEGFQRYFVYLNLFNFSMAGLIISTNLIQTYMFFVLSGIFSCLLYGFWHNKKITSDSSNKLFLLNIAGDCFILTGLILLLYFNLIYFPESNTTLLNYASLHDLCAGVISYATDFGFYIICLAIITGLILKSVLFTFFTNSDNRIESPSTSFAITESITCLISLICIMIRLLPVFNMSPMVIKTILYIGLSFSLICSVILLFQKYLRKILSYGLCSQIGLILAAIGIFSTSSGIFQVINLSFSIALLLLTMGLLIKIFGNSDDIRYMGGLRKNYPILAVLWLIGTLSFTGLFFSGAYSKIQLLNGFLEREMSIEYGILLLSSVLITFSFIKTYLSIFEGENHYQLDDKQNNTVHFQTKISLIILALTAICLSCFTYKFYGSLFDINIKSEFSIKGVVMYFVINIISAIFAFIFYKNNIFFGENLPKLNFSLKSVYKIFCKILYFFEKIVSEGIINFVKYFIKMLSYVISKTQNTSVQIQILLSAFGIILSILFAIFYYYILRGF